MRAGRRAFLWLAFAFGVAAGPAFAQLTDSKAPLDVHSAETVVRPAECLTIFSGGVEVRQARARLQADTLLRYQAKRPRGGGDRCGETERLEAHGHVYYADAPDRRAHADDAVYVAADDTLTLTGDVILIQGPNVQRAGRVVINVKTGDSISEPPPGGRVRTVIVPKSGP